jgi:glucose-6-phosphate isomerase
MANMELWQRYLDTLHLYDSVGLSLDISRMRVAEDFVGAMRPKIEEAFARMKDLEAGAIANPDEQRMVGHYWLRAPELSPNSETNNEIIANIAKIKEFSQQVHGGTISPQRQSTFKNVLVIGIGGSALGPQLVADALWNEKNPMKVYFCDNTDPDGITRTITQIGADLDKTLCLIISKSGGTIETRNGNLEVAHAYIKHGLDFGRHAVAITCAGSKLDKQAESEKWLDRFYMFDWVGGRTSIFSAVGLLPAALQGVNIDQFISGARRMDELTRQADALANPAAILALMWHSATSGKGAKDMVILPYKDRLCLFSRYLQQLVMESLGKGKDLQGRVVNQGIAVYGNKGSTDQHAYVQQLREGVNNFFVTFVEVLADYVEGSGDGSNLEVEPGITSGDYLSGFFLGTRNALHENNRESITITLDKLDAAALGALIALYERAVGFYASLVNINAYHQPGVEAGKKAAAQVISLQKKLLQELRTNKGATAGLSVIELSRAVGSEEQAETAYKILEHLAANPTRGIKRTGPRHPLKARYMMC